MAFKRENFAGMTEADKEPTFWEVVLDMHNADDESHEKLFSALKQSLLGHTGAEGLHVSQADRDLWAELKALFGDAEALRLETETFKNSAQASFEDAQKAADDAKASLETISEHAAAAEKAEENAAYYSENARAHHEETERLSGEVLVNAQSASASREAAESAAVEAKETLENKANKGAAVLDAASLPEDASFGVIHETGGVVANYPVKLITGRFGDLFEYYEDETMSGYEIVLDANMYSDYVALVSDDGRQYTTHVYNADDGSYVGFFARNEAFFNSVENLHGYSGSDDDVVSFYICQHADAVFSDEKRRAWYRGSDGWVELPDIESIGDIQTALLEIEAMADTLIGGDAE